MNLYRKALRITGSVLLVYALLVATHRGEFWPFSIYPMFSQAGHAWSRAVVRQVEKTPDAVSWDTLRADALPGIPFTLQDANVNPVDMANFITRTDRWSPQDTRGLQRLFREPLAAGTKLMVMRVNGGFDADKEIAVTFIPSLYLTSDTVLIHPAIQVRE